MARPPAPPAVSDLIFSSEQANHNFSRVLGDLRRSNHSITNRLRSIQQDAAFVRRAAAAAAPGLPLVVNERCGSWYVAPAEAAASAYFKSTDGHTGEWRFSTRRLNLHLLGVIGSSGMPDALSKTIPIWCSVLNRVLFPDRVDSHAIRVPRSVVSDSERSQIAARLPALADAFRQLQIDPAPLRQQLGRPLRPEWLTQDEGLEVDSDTGPDRDLSRVNVAPAFHPVVCCTSSRRTTDRSSGDAYVQGAGDDTEHWAHGLTAPLFWAHADTLLATPEGELPGLIASLVAASKDPDAVSAQHRQLTPFLSVAPLARAGAASEDEFLLRIMPTSAEVSETGAREMGIALGQGRAAGRKLRTALPSICERASQLFGSRKAARMVVACETGRDLAVGVALAVDCWCFDDSGNIRDAGEAVTFTKDIIRVRLGRIMTAMPEANPSRATLQSVNSFLMEWHK